MGVDGRKTLVDEWAAFLPTYADPFTIVGSSANAGPSASNLSGPSAQQHQTTSSHQSGADSNNSPSRSGAEIEQEEDHDDEDDGEGKFYFLLLHTFSVFKRFASYYADVALRRPGRSMELKRRHATAIVLLGVIGAEFGQDVEDIKSSGAESRKRAPVEGFGLGSNQNLARLTSKYSILYPGFI